MRRNRNVKIVATLGPASSSLEMLEKLFLAGVDVFRINMSHTAHDLLRELHGNIRAVEAKLKRPIGILADLQGPKIRIGTFAEKEVKISAGDTFVFDTDKTPGDATRVHLPHPEIFASAQAGDNLLLNDGRLRVEIVKAEADKLTTRVIFGGILSNRKGVNLPDTVIPIPALTEKDRADLEAAASVGVDWIALSFVQRADDVAEARKLVSGRAGVMAKIEKPAALPVLDEILEIADGLMVARGDLGVELPPEAVPPAQKRIVETARRFGRPVVVATQMLESMIKAPTPTRAEVSDVATAIYDGADAVMLSAESAAGDWPIESVAMMDRIAINVESDPAYAARVHFTETRPDPTTADALSEAAFDIVRTVSAKCIICFTESGSTARRIARERPLGPILVLTPKLATARRLGLLWGVHAVSTRDVSSFEEMVAKSKRMALRHGIAGGGDRVIMMAGVPFGTPGSTNVLHVVRLTGQELKGR